MDPISAIEAQLKNTNLSEPKKYALKKKLRVEKAKYIREQRKREQKQRERNHEQKEKGNQGSSSAKRSQFYL